MSKIRKKSKPSQWRFVDSEKNPADLCSRGIKADETEKWKLYLEGPDFLREKEEAWDGMMKAKPVGKAKLAVLVTAEETKMSADEERDLWIWETVSKISDWQSKVWLLVRLRKMAAIIRVKATWKASRSRTKELERIEKQTLDSFVKCEKEIFRAIQAQYFREERRTALKKRSVTSRPKGRDFEEVVAPSAS